MAKNMLIPLFLFLWFPGITPQAQALGDREPLPIPAKKVTSEQLGGPERYLTFIATDKPLYRPGEPVYIRGTVLNARDHTPFTGSSQVVIRVTDPRGQLIQEDYGYVENSVVGHQWQIPPELPGGEYTIHIAYDQSQNGVFTPAQRKIRIRTYRAPRLKTRITFLKEGFYPGETVQALCAISRAEGGVPVGAQVQVTARVDNKTVHTASLTLDNRGVCRASFDLPQKIDQGEGTLVFSIEDGGVTESAAKTIPLLLDNFDIRFFPEGGELVAGVENRVYVEARFKNGKPAHIQGALVDRKGKTISNYTTTHEGRGRFVFTPQPGNRYTLKLLGNDGTPHSYPLPVTRKGGVVLQSLADRYTQKEALTFRLASPRSRAITLELSQKERTLVQKKINLEPGQWSQVSLSPPQATDGILVATVWEGNLPLAERLVYREPADHINMELSLDKDNPSPGDTLTLLIKTTDAQGKPLGAQVGLTVTDESVRKLQEQRDTPPDLRSMVFLENEVQELADAPVYLDPHNPQAPLQLDLLLGTQGWRRFAFLHWEQFLKSYGDKAKGVAALRLPQPLHPKPQILLRGLVAEQEGAGLEKAAAPVVAEAPVDLQEQKRNQDAPFAQKQQGLAQNMLALDDPEEKAKRMEPPLSSTRQFIPIRIYAHKKRPNWSANSRSDFTETLYWTAALTTDPVTGLGKARFDLNDSISSFAILADSFNSQGLVGSSSTVFSSVKPFYMEPRMPLTVTQGDQLLIPLALVNNLQNSLKGQIQVLLDNQLIRTIPATLDKNSRTRKLITLTAEPPLGTRVLLIRGEFGEHSDRVRRGFQVAAPGFPREQHRGGILKPDEPASFNLTLADNIITDSLTTSIKIYTSPVANLSAALKALIRKPYGCFEQTSSTSYPLVMAQHYFLTHSDVDPELIRESQQNLRESLQRLTGFECSQQGYEWFGESPGHEALTAYGLMQFMEMREVMDVDASMIQRTRTWLLGRRDGQGGYKRNPRALDSFGGAPQATTNAYITWALLMAGESDLEKEVAKLKENGFQSKDSYILALAANALYRAGRIKDARVLMERLKNQQAQDGHIRGAVTSITRSGGESLKIETTALTILAWLNEDQYAANVEKAMQYLVNQCQNGMFFSTQGTILALKAIILYDNKRAKLKRDGSLQLLVDGKPLGQRVSFSKEYTGVLELPDFSSVLTAGRHTITIEMSGGAAFPFSATCAYASLLPASDQECRLALDVRLTDQKIEEGGATELQVTLSNRTQEVIPTPIAVIGIPGGLEPRYEQLKELVQAGVADAFEVKGQEVVLYWRHLAPQAFVRFSLSCLAGLPGRYTAPASRTYEYYTAEYQQWVGGSTITIRPRQ